MYRWLDFGTWKSHVQMFLAASMKARAVLRFSTESKICATGKCGKCLYFRTARVVSIRAVFLQGA